MWGSVEEVKRGIGVWKVCWGVYQHLISPHLLPHPNTFSHTSAHTPTPFLLSSFFVAVLFCCLANASVCMCGEWLKINNINELEATQQQHDVVYTWAKNFSKHALVSSLRQRCTTKMKTKFSKSSRCVPCHFRINGGIINKLPQN